MCVYVWLEQEGQLIHWRQRDCDVNHNQHLQNGSGGQPAAWTCEYVDLLRAQLASPSGSPPRGSLVLEPTSKWQDPLNAPVAPEAQSVTWLWEWLHREES